MALKITRVVKGSYCPMSRAQFFRFELLVFRNNIMFYQSRNSFRLAEFFDTMYHIIVPYCCSPLLAG